MEKWAKSQNKKSKSGNTTQLPPSATAQQQIEDDDGSLPADTAYDLLVGGKRLPPTANGPPQVRHNPVHTITSPPPCLNAIICLKIDVNFMLWLV